MENLVLKEELGSLKEDIKKINLQLDILKRLEIMTEKKEVDVVI